MPEGSSSVISTIIQMGQAIQELGIGFWDAMNMTVYEFLETYVLIDPIGTELIGIIQAITGFKIMDQPLYLMILGTGVLFALAYNLISWVIDLLP